MVFVLVIRLRNPFGAFPFLTPGLIVLALVAGPVSICALYRVIHGMPVFFFSVPGADFMERAVSGHGFAIASSSPSHPAV